jgi:hypothetical protein
MREFLLLQEAHGKLAKRVKSKACNMGVVMTANLWRKNIAPLVWIEHVGYVQD